VSSIKSDQRKQTDETDAILPHSGILKAPSGIEGFDEITGGGLQKLMRTGRGAKCERTLERKCKLIETRILALP
jgi:hypothetical protein